MGEIVKPFAQWVSGNLGWTVLGILFILSLFFEFSKIKLSPITAIIRWIGDRLTSGIKLDIAEMKRATDEKLDEMQKNTDERMSKLEDSMAEMSAKSNLADAEFQRKLNEIEESQDLSSAARIKAHVLGFSRQCRNREKHTVEDFENLIAENAEYERLMKKYGDKWKNDVYTEDYKFILTDYHRCNVENDFLR